MYICPEVALFIKHTVVFALLALMIIRMLAMPIAYVSYQMNKTYIASALCVNKARPALKCNGQCFLRKQLEKANENTATGNEKAVFKFNTLDSFDQPLTYSSATISLEFFLWYNAENSLFSPGFPGNIFHPPLGEISYRTFASIS